MNFFFVQSGVILYLHAAQDKHRKKNGVVTWMLIYTTDLGCFFFVCLFTEAAIIPHRP